MAIAQELSKQGTKANPRAVATEIQKNLPNIEVVEKTEIAGPGFINVHLSVACITSWIACVFAKGLTPPVPKQRLRIVVDFSSPNVAKEMHVGHLRSTIIGDSVCRLFELLGHDVLRLNHIGDWGTQFGMLIAHLHDTLHLRPGEEHKVPGVAQLLTLYKASKKRFDEDAEFNKRAHDLVVKLQSGDPGTVKLWQACCDRSRAEFNKIYARLDVTLTERGESFYQQRMEQLVDDLKQKGVMKFEDGRYVLFGKGQTVPLTIVKSDGGFTYGTSDMAALTNRVKEEKADWIIYVVDAGQGQHLETVYAAGRDLGIYDPAKVRVDHCAFGVVCGEDGQKLKTRSGETVRLVDLLDEGLTRAKDTLRSKGRDAVLAKEEFDATAEAVAYGCIKYADLSHNRTKNYVFSFDRMLEDRGNTAVYLLYAYTRIRSIARNAGVSREELAAHLATFRLEHEKEVQLAKTLRKFWDTIASVVEDLFLNSICDYLYEVACHFTEFYDSCYCVQKAADGTVTVDYNRLILAESTADVMKACFNVLGIRTVERM